MELSDLQAASKTLEALHEETMDQALSDYRPGRPHHVADSMALFADAICLYRAMEICGEWIEAQQEDGG